MEKQFKKRIGLAVWVYTNRHVHKLKRYGFIHYVSKKMNYVILYIDQDQKEETIKAISDFHFVKKIEESHKQEMRMDFQAALEEYGELVVEKNNERK